LVVAGDFVVGDEKPLPVYNKDALALPSFDLVIDYGGINATATA